MRQVRPKKYLGQHFLKDQEIARRIADALEPEGKYRQALEIGPGMGVLTRYLIERDDLDLKVIEIDQESVVYLKEHFPVLKERIVEGDFLNINPDELFEGPFAIIGNFPYNISSQILFRALEYRDRIPEIAGMFQKEVAERIASPPGSRHYGILSVLLQAYYDIEYLFTVDEHVFDPPPKVKSGVIRLKRNGVLNLPCDEKAFIKVVKAGFNQRRKTLRNALSQILPKGTESPLLSLRAERLSVADFVELTLLAEKL